MSFVNERLEALLICSMVMSGFVAGVAVGHLYTKWRMRR